jgi:hypothetical protein
MDPFTYKYPYGYRIPCTTKNTHVFNFFDVCRKPVEKENFNMVYHYYIATLGAGAAGGTLEKSKRSKRRG